MIPEILDHLHYSTTLLAHIGFVEAWSNPPLTERACGSRHLLNDLPNRSTVNSISLQSIIREYQLLPPSHDLTDLLRISEALLSLDLHQHSLTHTIIIDNSFCRIFVENQ